MTAYPSWTNLTPQNQSEPIRRTLDGLRKWLDGFQAHNDATYLPGASKASTTFPASDAGCNSLSTVDIPSTSFSFTKVGAAAATSLEVGLGVNGLTWNVASPGWVTLSVGVGAVDTPIAIMGTLAVNANNADLSMSGWGIITGVAAGTFTVKGRWGQSVTAGGASAYLKGGRSSTWLICREIPA